MTDVARTAGVSAQTVSRVLNNPERVAAPTRERVLSAIKMLGYRRNSSARALKRSRSETIGVIHTGSSAYGPQSMLDAIEQAARRESLGTQVAVAGGSAREARDAIDHLLDYGIDGLVAVSTFEWMVEVVRRVEVTVPIVAVEAGSRGSGNISVVAVDQVGGALEMMKHLYDQGYRRIDHLSGPPAWLDGRERIIGWRQFLAQHPDVTGRLVEGDWDAQSGYDYVQRYADDLPDAIYAGNDAMAAGILRGLWERGIAVPDQVAVAGTDDVAVSAFLCPALTTEQQPFVQVGSMVVETLIGRMKGFGASTVVVPTQLIPRESTAAREGMAAR